MEFQPLNALTNLTEHEITECNIVLLTIDSCRYDSWVLAQHPFLDTIGEVRQACAMATFTLPAHQALFNGMLPSVLDMPYLPYYTPAIKQLFRVQLPGNVQFDRNKNGLILSGNSIIQGLNQLGYRTIGISPIHFFQPQSPLVCDFSQFFSIYNTKRRQMENRSLSHFPLNEPNLSPLMETLRSASKWFLFVNTDETHYPYDTGKQNLDSTKQDVLQKLSTCINLRHGGEQMLDDECRLLHSMQIDALQTTDERIATLFEVIPKNRPIITIVCGDHGESFGETFYGLQRFGHIHASPEVMSVPIVFGLYQ